MFCQSFFICLASLATGLLAGTATATELTAPCVDVIDGDTIVVEIDGVQVRVDLRAIDAPETGQPFGEQARQFTESKVRGEKVTLQAALHSMDNPMVAQVMIGDLDLARALLKAGLAWHDTIHDDQEDLVIEHIMARGSKTGLWIESDAMPPWQWREAHVPTPTPAPLHRRVRLADIGSDYEFEKNQGARTVIRQPTPSVQSQKRLGDSGANDASSDIFGPKCCCEMEIGDPEGSVDDMKTEYRMTNEYSCENAVAIINYVDNTTMVPQGCVNRALCD
ncbi:MAG: hypothetical protein DRJ65_01180 [Acidobacteria bacterium]|nr:MAG: hypothetical protein DRJ65_01180 [Acidobacteriota bacterium]